MKVLVCTKPGTLDYAQRLLPETQPGHAIIKIKRIGICGTDLHAYDGTQPYFTYPKILGHELAADFIEADGTHGFITGEPVTVMPYFNCGHCIACRNGTPNCCVRLQVCGVHIDGGMAEYLSVPVSALLRSNGLSYDQLALVEPLAIGAHGVRRAAIRQGEFVLVMGAGPIGLCTMEFARIAGATVIAVDVNENRVRFCKDKLDVPHTINAARENVLARLQEITSGDMPAVIVDATGNQNAINTAVQYLAHGGRFVLVGLQKEPLSFSHPEFHKREATLMSSRNATRQDFLHVMDCIKKEWINPLNYITHRVPFEAVKDAFETWLNPETNVIKAMVEME